MSAIAMDAHDRSATASAVGAEPTPSRSFASATSTPITARATSCRACRFDMRQGEILALLGRNGAGKTSTLRTIARIDDPQLQQRRDLARRHSRCTR